jgi:hypothetical protein
MRYRSVLIAAPFQSPLRLILPTAHFGARLVRTQPRIPNANGSPVLRGQLARRANETPKVKATWRWWGFPGRWLRGMDGNRMAATLGRRRTATKGLWRHAAFAFTTIGSLPF